MNNPKRTLAFALAAASSLAVSSAWADCTTTTSSKAKVDGSSLWQEVASPSGHGTTDCNVDQFAWNNFLYLTADDGKGHSRFMSDLAPWFDAMPKENAPKWPGHYSPLNAGQMVKKLNQSQAGDDFELVDVAGDTVSYDIRINQPFFDYIAKSGTYNKANIAVLTNEFNSNTPKNAGIWVPPTSASDKNNDSLEIKTSWRRFGHDSNACPKDTMYCEQDTDGDWWGLIGMHVAQKTPIHGEWIWASFEHIANAPDCAPGGSSPIAQFPAVNSNNGLDKLKGVTGWNLFNYQTYKAAGGDGKTCTYPTVKANASPQCLGNPKEASGKYVAVNVCRTDPLPPAIATACISAEKGLQVTSCLNQSVQTSLSKSSVWKNYQLIGVQYTFWGSTATGAPLNACWNLAQGKDVVFKCPNQPYSDENTVALQGQANLANATMETWMQKNVYLEVGGNTVSATNCFGCHQPTTASYEGDLSHLFGRARQALTEQQPK